MLSRIIMSYRVEFILGYGTWVFRLDAGGLYKMHTCRRNIVFLSD